MAAIFNYAAVYQVDAVCRTPLRTGGTDGDTETVLRYRDGTAFLQGSSLAGALRSWLEDVDRAAAERLFGSLRGGGRLIISDAVFDVDAGQDIRLRLRIDEDTGSADQGGKFDIAQISRGSKLHFTLTWLGDTGETGELETVERLLAALHYGEIRLGAQKSNGFGRVELSVQKRTLDMHSAEDRAAWLEDRVEGAPLTLAAERISSHVVFTLTGRADNVLVRAGFTEQNEAGSYTPNIREGCRAILPGSSVKGAVRARVTAITKLMGVDRGPADVQMLFGRGAAGGDSGKQGRVRFEDILIEREAKRPQTRIRIDRFTGGVMRGGLFREAPVSGVFKTHITAPDQPEACALLLYALRDLGIGLYNLGSGGSIGRGFLCLERLEAAAPDGRSAALLFDGRGAAEAEDPDGLFRDWLDALEEVRHEN